MRTRAALCFTLVMSLGLAAASQGYQVGAAGQQEVPLPPFGGDAGLSMAGLGGMARPYLPPQGDWAEVIMADRKWVVLQNAQGQQFPLSYDSIRQFYVRWPATVDSAAPNALVEVTGVDIGTNQMRADHIDLYENEARGLVSPTFLRLVGYNRVYSAIDVEQEQTYGIYFPMMPSEYAVPRRIHVVGPILAQNPLRLSIEGNNSIAVLPAPTGVTVTQVTVGAPNVAQVGDLAYFVAQNAGPKSLQVSQLVLYKTVPYRGFPR